MKKKPNLALRSKSVLNFKDSLSDDIQLMIGQPPAVAQTKRRLLYTNVSQESVGQISNQDMAEDFEFFR